jgi:hypothetical protein
MRNPEQFKIRPSQLGKIMTNGKVKGELGKTCQTYLIDWYTDNFEEISSKYMTKGLLKEDDAIDFMATTLNYGIAEKNINIYANDWCVGTPDVIIDKTVIDLKCAWSQKTLLDSATELNSDYEWQLRAYMWLTECEDAILFYALMDTPSECNYGIKIQYEHLPISQRWVAYKFKRDKTKEEQIKYRVEQCIEWLENYDDEIKKKLGNIQEL